MSLLNSIDYGTWLLSWFKIWNLRKMKTLILKNWWVRENWTEWFKLYLFYIFEHSLPLFNHFVFSFLFNYVYICWGEYVAMIMVPQWLEVEVGSHGASYRTIVSHSDMATKNWMWVLCTSSKHSKLMKHFCRSKTMFLFLFFCLLFLVLR